MANVNIYKYALLLLPILALSGDSAKQQCTTPKPGDNWVCVGSDWLPPGHPKIVSTPEPVVESPTADVLMTAPPPIWPPVPATGPNAWIIDAANTGTPLPSGEVYFTPPLVLENAAMLRGTAGRTILRPNSIASGPLVIVQNAVIGDADTYYPRRTVIQDVRIQCIDPSQVGLLLSAAVTSIERVEITGCAEGLNLRWAVNVKIRDSLFTRNGAGIAIWGRGSGDPLSVTTVSISGSRIGQNTTYGIRIGHGIGIVLDDQTIIEGNAGIGLYVEPWWSGSPISVLLRDVWLEANSGGHIYDPYGAVRYEGFTGGH